jgi:hypothetical protein
LDDLVARVSLPGADGYRQLARHLRQLDQKAALAHTGGPLDQDDRTDAREQLVELLAEDGPFPLATTKSVVRDTIRGAAGLRSRS